MLASDGEMGFTVLDARQRFFEARPESVGLARGFATMTLKSWRLTGLVEDIRLCVSELASNALLHGTEVGHGFLVRMAADSDFVCLEVHDSRGSDRQPEARSPDATDTSGRGLLLVTAIADGWGVEKREPFGKVVWTRFKTRAGAGPVWTSAGARFGQDVDTARREERGSMSQNEGARLFRETWIAGVRQHFPGEPKSGYVTPWEDTPDWERDAAGAVYEQVRHFLSLSGGHASRLTREQKGRFVATCWTAQMFKHFEDPKPGYVADWPDLPEWQMETDSDIFEAVEKSLN